MRRSGIEKLDNLLVRIGTELPVLLGNGLCGAYLYGSLTQGAFDPDESDIDCIVVTKNDLSDHEFSSLGRWFERLAYTNIWTTRLQMQFLVLNELTESGNGCLYQFGQWKRTGSDGNPIVWLNILNDGFLIYGMRPDTIVPEITPAMLRDALLRETEYLRSELSDPESQWRDVPKYRRYSVLTLCRILYSYTTGEIASKPVAASWAMERIPKDLLVVLQATLSGDDRKSPDIEVIHGFIDFVMRSISRDLVDHRSSTTNVS